MDAYRELLDAWKKADHDAKLAEKLLTERLNASLSEGAPIPTDEERLVVQQLRAKAAAKLTAAVQQLGHLARNNRDGLSRDRHPAGK